MLKFNGGIMNIIEIIRKMINGNKPDVFKGGNVILNELRKNCVGEEGFVQFLQFKILLDVYADFAYELIRACKSGAHLDKLKEISERFDAASVSAELYAYYLYAILNACGVSSDTVEWRDPLHPSSVSQSGESFGVGAYLEPTDDLEVNSVNGALRGFSGKRELVTLPESITAISAGALSKKPALKWVIASASLRRIAENAFAASPMLEFVFLPSSVTEIPEGCFSEDRSLSLVIALGIKRVGAKAFNNTNISSIKRIGGDSLEIIDQGAFARCKGLKKIDISKVKTVGMGAFAYCYGISHLTVSGASSFFGGRLMYLFTKDPGTFKSEGYSLEEIEYICKDGVIPEGFFSGLDTVKRITVKGDVKVIGKDAFSGCSALSDISMSFVGDAVPENAFKGCAALKAPSLLSSVKEIGASAFEGCSSISDLTLGMNVTRVAKGAFALCTGVRMFKFYTPSLAGITVAEMFGTAPSEFGKDGYQLDKIVCSCKDGVLPESFFSGLDTVREIGIIDDVNTIGAGAFAGCAALTSVAMKFKGSDIPKNAFRGCVSLSQLPALESARTIGSMAFLGCTSLKSVSIPKSVTRIGGGAFAFCKSLETFKISLSSVIDGGVLLNLFAKNADDLTRDGYALNEISVSADGGAVPPEYFSGLSTVTRISVVGDVASVGASAFKGCASLKSVRMSFVGDKLPSELLYGCSSLTELPSFSSVKTVGTSAFYGCSLIRKVSLPSGVTFVGESAFEGCAELENIGASYVGGAIPSRTFKGCVKLKVGNMLGNVVSIGDEAFSGCIFESGLTISDNVKSIGRAAFAGASVGNVLRIPALTSVSGAIFEGVKGIIALYLDTTFFTDGGKPILPYKLFAEDLNDFNKNYSGIVNVKLISDTVAEGAFAGWESLEKFIFEKPIAVLPKDTFRGCHSLSGVKFADGATVIEKGAFKDCTSLVNIKIKTDAAAASKEACADISFASAVRAGAFEGCSFKSISISSECDIADCAFADSHDIESLTVACAADGVIRPIYRLFSEDSDTFAREYPHLTSVTVSGADVLSGTPFAGCGSIQSIKFKTPVRVLGDAFFSGSASLISVDGEFIGEELPKDAFSGCTDLVTVFDLAKVKKIGDAAFSGCESLVSVRIGEVESVGEGAFRDCTSLKEIKGSINCDRVGNAAFKGCTSLTDFSFMGSASEIGSYAFEGTACNVIPKGVKHIGCGAYKNVKFPESLVIPDEITVERLAFEGASGIVSLTVENAALRNRAGEPISLYELFADSFAAFEAEDGSARSVRNVNIELGLTRSMLQGWKYIEKVFLSDPTLTEIPEACFSGCESLVAVKLAASGIDIAAGAFSGCSALKRVAVGNGERPEDGRLSLLGVGTVGEYAFKDCTSIESIELLIGKDYPVLAFAGCTSVRELKIDIAPEAEISDHKIFDIFESEIRHFNSKYNALAKITVSGMSSLPDGYFAYCSALHDITVADTVTEIGEGCFRGCSQLERIGISYTGDIIPASCFEGCTSLRELTGFNIDAVKRVGELAFANTQYNRIPKNAVHIGKGAYKNVAMPKELHLGARVSAERLAFEGVTGVGALCLENADIRNASGESVKIFELFAPSMSDFERIKTGELYITDLRLGGGLTEGAFRNWKSLQHAVLDGKGITEIPAECFKGCINLETVKISAEGVKIAMKAFENCKKLKRVSDGEDKTREGHLSLLDVDDVDDGAFAGCAGFTTVEMRIGKRMPHLVFAGCRDITDIALEFSPTAELADARFHMLFAETAEELSDVHKSLTKVTVRGLSDVPDGFFEGCTAIKEIVFTTPTSSVGSSCFKSCTGLERVELSIANGTVSSSCFDGCSSLKSIKGLNMAELKGVGDYAFYGTSLLECSWDMPELEYIGDFAFAEGNMKKAVFGEALEHIGISPFSGISRLEELTIPARFSSLAQLFDWREFKNSKKIVQTLPEKKSRSFYIPSALSRITVVGGELGVGMFSEMSIRVDVKSPILEVPAYAFFGFKGKLDINLASVVNIGEHAFSGSDADTLDIGSDISFIHDSALEDTHIRSITVKGGSRSYSCVRGMLIDEENGRVIYVAKDAFDDLTVPANVRSINDYAFANCENIISVNCSNVVSVGRGAFAGCTGLFEIAINDTAEYVGEGILEGCGRLTHIRLPFIGETRDRTDGFEYLFGDTKLGDRISLTVLSGSVRNGLLSGRSYDELDISGIKNNILSPGFISNATVSLLHLPLGVMRIDPKAFARFSAKKIATVPRNGTIVITEDSIFDGNMLIYRYKNADKLVIKRGIAGIADNAFDLNDSVRHLVLESVIDGVLDKISGSLERLEIHGDIAYPIGMLVKDTSSLTEIEYHGSLSVDDMFAGLSALKTVNIPNVKCIKKRFFADDKRLSVIKDMRSVSEIEENAFSGCTSLSRIKLSSAITSIDESVFDNIVIKNLELEDNDHYIMVDGCLVSSSGRLIFAQRSLAGRIALDDRVTDIREKAFMNCKNIEEIVVKTVNKIGTRAFSGCESLLSLEVGAVTGVGEQILFDSERITTVRIPFIGASKEDTRHLSYLFGDSVSPSLRAVILSDQRVIDGTFEGCTGLTSVTLAENTETITSESFHKCIGISRIVIPASVKKICDHAFLGCSRKLEVELFSREHASDFEKKWNVLSRGVIFGLLGAKAKVTYRTN